MKGLERKCKPLHLCGPVVQAAYIQGWYAGGCDCNDAATVRVEPAPLSKCKKSRRSDIHRAGGH